MRIAHLSDLHIHEGPRLDDQREVLTRVARQIRRRGPGVVLLTGDLYGRTVPHRSTAAERSVLLDALVELRGIPVVIVAGNHDIGLDLEGLGALEHVRVATRPIVLDLEEEAAYRDMGHPRARVYCLPYPWRGWLLGSLPEAPGVVEGQATLEGRLRALLTGWGARMTEDVAQGVTPILAAHIQIQGSTTSGGEVLGPHEVTLSRHDLDSLPAEYVALGHLHCAQQVGRVAWYAGSPWPTDHAEGPDVKCWIEAVDGRVDLVETSPRPFRTLDWRWAPRPGEEAPAWRTRPSDLELLCVRDAEVRARLTVPQPWVGSVPWEGELARLRAAGAHRVVEERSIEPVLRARAPEVAAATTIDAKIGAYWGTLATTPTPEEQGAALDALALLRAEPDDERLAARIRGTACP